MMQGRGCGCGDLRGCDRNNAISPRSEQRVWLVQISRTHLTARTPRISFPKAGSNTKNHNQILPDEYCKHFTNDQKDHISKYFKSLNSGGITAMRTCCSTCQSSCFAPRFSNLSLDIHNPEQLPPIDFETLQCLLRLNLQSPSGIRKDIWITFF